MSPQGGSVTDEPDYKGHVAVLMSGTVTCRCGWESGHSVMASDAVAEYEQHLADEGVAGAVND